MLNIDKRATALNNDFMITSPYIVSDYINFKPKSMVLCIILLNP